MLTPYLVLGLSPGASETEIRRRYLELVRENPPERGGERFERIAAAYEALKDERTRVETAVLGASRYDDFELALMDLVRARPPKRRCPGLKALLGNKAEITPVQIDGRRETADSG